MTADPKRKTNAQLTAENEALAKRVAELEAQVAARIATAPDTLIPPWRWFEDPANFETTAGCGWREVLSLVREYKDFAHRVLSNQPNPAAIEALCAMAAADQPTTQTAVLQVRQSDVEITPSTTSMRIGASVPVAAIAATRSRYGRDAAVQFALDNLAGLTRAQAEALTDERASLEGWSTDPGGYRYIEHRPAPAGRTPHGVSKGSRP
jgi:hypothetical protein